MFVNSDFSDLLKLFNANNVRKMIITKKNPPAHVNALRWLARIMGSLFFMLFAILFFNDGLPFYFFAIDPVHMIALSIALMGFLLGWKSDFWAWSFILGGTLADWIIVSIQYGEMVTHMGPLVSFFPCIGFMYWYCWWRSKRTQT